MTVNSKKTSDYFVFKKKSLFICIIILNVSNMYISSIVVVFSSEKEPSMLSTTVYLDHVSGCSLLHAMEFINKSPMVKFYLNNKYYIINLTLKYSLL